MAKKVSPKSAFKAALIAYGDQLRGIPLNVVDATEALEVTVARKHANKGIRGHAGACAIMRALYDGEAANYVVIGGKVATIIFRNRKHRFYALRYTIPAATGAMIKQFDNGGAFEPGRYSLDAPTKGRKLGIKRDRKMRKHKTRIRSSKSRARAIAPLARRMGAPPPQIV